jgi:hypothetical protein
MRRPKGLGRRKDSGFALLLIFALAAAAAIYLYLEIPRAVFEAARIKEDILVERGEEYKKAIRRYFVKNKQKLPQTLDELEQQGGVRFLRRRYKDPMTGKDEWRLIHMGPMGLTDSKVEKPVNPADQKEKRESSISEGYQVGGGNAPNGDAPKGIQDIAMRQRNESLPGTFPGTEQPQPSDPAAVGAPPAPGQQPTLQPGQAPGFSALPGSVANSQQGGTVPQGTLTQQQPPQQQPAAFPGQQGYLGQQLNPQAPPGGLGQQPQSGAVPQGQNPALDMIRGLLTTPRQGPVPGTAVMPQQPAAVTGIAGVASKYEGEGIKRINERSRIDEWEFVYDYRKDARGGGQSGAQGVGMAGGAAGGAGRGAAGGQAQGLGPGGQGQGRPPGFQPGATPPGAFMPIQYGPDGRPLPPPQNNQRRRQ